MDTAPLPGTFHHHDVIRIPRNYLPSGLNKDGLRVQAKLEQGVLHVPKNPGLVQGLCKVPEHMEFHSLVQIIPIRGDDKNFNMGVTLLQPGPCVDTTEAGHLYVQESDVHLLFVFQQGFTGGIGGIFRLLQVPCPKKFPQDAL